MGQTSLYYLYIFIARLFSFICKTHVVAFLLLTREQNVYLSVAKVINTIKTQIRSLKLLFPLSKSGKYKLKLIILGHQTVYIFIGHYYSPTNDEKAFALPISTC